MLTLLWLSLLLARADHPLVKPYQGSELKDRLEKEYDAVAFPTGKIPIGKYSGPLLRLEGKITRLVYQSPKGRSTLEIFRNYGDALAQGGFREVHRAEGAALGFPYNLPEIMGLNKGSICYDPIKEDSRFLIARKQAVHVAVYVAECRGGTSPKTLLWIVEGKAMDTGKVEISAAEMKRALQESGRVALYGIHFDFDKADIRPDSGPTLAEILKLLQANPKLRLYVVGHTDMEGKLDYNLALSQKRAKAVVAHLRGKGVDPARLDGHGVGPLAPLGSNTDGAGRALNRRVELVQRLP